ncbi:unnamed protein product [Amoebophrya sp. A25]|nr:unnamed protein product [Amoebophrya sp. A25]|eukprot:GSA25T00017552001.1
MQDLRRSMKSLGQTMRVLVGRSPRRRGLSVGSGVDASSAAAMPADVLKESLVDDEESKKGGAAPGDARTSNVRSPSSPPFLYVTDDYEAGSSISEGKMNSSTSATGGARGPTTRGAEQPADPQTALLEDGTSSVATLQPATSGGGPRTPGSAFAAPSSISSKSSTSGVGLGTSWGQRGRIEIHPDVHVNYAQVEGGRLSLQRIPHHDHPSRHRVSMHGESNEAHRAKTPANSPVKKIVLSKGTAKSVVPAPGRASMGAPVGAPTFTSSVATTAVVRSSVPSSTTATAAGAPVVEAIPSRISFPGRSLVVGASIPASTTTSQFAGGATSSLVLSPSQRGTVTPTPHNTPYRVSQATAKSKPSGTSVSQNYRQVGPQVVQRNVVFSSSSAQNQMQSQPSTAAPQIAASVPVPSSAKAGALVKAKPASATSSIGNTTVSESATSASSTPSADAPSGATRRSASMGKRVSFGGTSTAPVESVSSTAAGSSSASSSSRSFSSSSGVGSSTSSTLLASLTGAPVSGTRTSSTAGASVRASSSPAKVRGSPSLLNVQNAPQFTHSPTMHRFSIRPEEEAAIPHHFRHEAPALRMPPREVHKILDHVRSAATDHPHVSHARDHLRSLVERARPSIVPRLSLPHHNSKGDTASPTRTSGPGGTVVTVATPKTPQPPAPPSLKNMVVVQQPAFRSSPPSMSATGSTAGGAGQVLSGTSASSGSTGPMSNTSTGNAVGAGLSGNRVAIVSACSRGASREIREAPAQATRTSSLVVSPSGSKEVQGVPGMPVASLITGGTLIRSGNISPMSRSPTTPSGIQRASSPAAAVAGVTSIKMQEHLQKREEDIHETHAHINLENLNDIISNHFTHSIFASGEIADGSAPDALEKISQRSEADKKSNSSRGSSKGRTPSARTSKTSNGARSNESSPSALETGPAAHSLNSARRLEPSKGAADATPADVRDEGDGLSPSPMRVVTSARRAEPRNQEDSVKNEIAATAMSSKDTSSTDQRPAQTSKQPSSAPDDSAGRLSSQFVPPASSRRHPHQEKRAAEGEAAELEELRELPEDRKQFIEKLADAGAEIFADMFVAKTSARGADAAVEEQGEEQEITIDDGTEAVRASQPQQQKVRVTRSARALAQKNVQGDDDEVSAGSGSGRERDSGVYASRNGDEEEKELMSGGDSNVEKRASSGVTATRNDDEGGDVMSDLRSTALGYRKEDDDADVMSDGNVRDSAALDSRKEDKDEDAMLRGSEGVYPQERSPASIISVCEQVKAIERRTRGEESQRSTENSTTPRGTPLNANPKPRGLIPSPIEELDDFAVLPEATGSLASPRSTANQSRDPSKMQLAEESREPSKLESRGSPIGASLNASYANEAVADEEEVASFRPQGDPLVEEAASAEATSSAIPGKDELEPGLTSSLNLPLKVTDSNFMAVLQNMTEKLSASIREIQNKTEIHISSPAQSPGGGPQRVVSPGRTLIVVRNEEEVDVLRRGVDLPDNQVFPPQATSTSSRSPADNSRALRDEVEASARRHGPQGASLSFSDEVRVHSSVSLPVEASTKPQTRKIPDDDPDLLELKRWWQVPLVSPRRAQHIANHKNCQLSPHSSKPVGIVKGQQHDRRGKENIGATSPRMGSYPKVKQEQVTREVNASSSSARGAGNTASSFSGAARPFVSGGSTSSTRKRAFPLTTRSSAGSNASSMRAQPASLHQHHLQQMQETGAMNVSAIIGAQDESMLDVNITLVDELLNTSNIIPPVSSSPSHDAAGIQPSFNSVVINASSSSPAAAAASSPDMLRPQRLELPADLRRAAPQREGESPASSRGNMYTQRIQKDDPDLLALRQAWQPFQLRPLAANRRAAEEGEEVVVKHGDSPYKQRGFSADNKSRSPRSGRKRASQSVEEADVAETDDKKGDEPKPQESGTATSPKDDPSILFYSEAERRSIKTEEIPLSKHAADYDHSEKVGLEITAYPYATGTSATSGSDVLGVEHDQERARACSVSSDMVTPEAIEAMFSSRDGKNGKRHSSCREGVGGEHQQGADDLQSNEKKSTMSDNKKNPAASSWASSFDLRRDAAKGSSSSSAGSAASSRAPSKRRPPPFTWMIDSETARASLISAASKMSLNAATTSNSASQRSSPVVVGSTLSCSSRGGNGSIALIPRENERRPVTSASTAEAQANREAPKKGPRAKQGSGITGAAPGRQSKSNLKLTEGGKKLNVGTSSQLMEDVTVSTKTNPQKGRATSSISGVRRPPSAPPTRTTSSFTAFSSKPKINAIFTMGQKQDSAGFSSSYSSTSVGIVRSRSYEKFASTMPDCPKKIMGNPDGGGRSSFPHLSGGSVSTNASLLICKTNIKNTMPAATAHGGSESELVKRRRGGAPYKVPYSPRKRQHSTPAGSMSRVVGATGPPPKRHPAQPPGFTVPRQLPPSTTRRGPPGGTIDISRREHQTAGGPPEDLSLTLQSTTSSVRSLVVALPRPKSVRSSPKEGKGVILDLAHQRRQGSMSLSDIRQQQREKSRSKTSQAEANAERHRKAQERRRQMMEAHENTKRTRQLHEEARRHLYLDRSFVVPQSGGAEADAIFRVRRSKSVEGLRFGGAAGAEAKPVFFPWSRTQTGQDADNHS